MLLARVGVVFLWFATVFWWSCDSLRRKDTRRIMNSRYPEHTDQCYDLQTGIVVPPNGVVKKFKHLCMRATCFHNYTMLVESCKRTTCVIPNVKYTRNYPHCCPEVICRNNHRLRYLLTNKTVATIPTRRPPKTGKKAQRRKAKRLRQQQEQEQWSNETAVNISRNNTQSP